MPQRALLALVLFAASRVMAGDVPPGATSPQLPWKHWAVQAAQRLDELGLVTGWLPAQREAPLFAVEAALTEAEQRAPLEAPQLAELAAAWNRRFHEEWLGAAPAREDIQFLGGAACASYTAQDRSGKVTAADQSPGKLVEPAPSAQGQLDVLAAVSAGPALTAVVAPQLTGGDLHLERGEIVAGAGAFRLSLGRAPVRYGYAESGAVVFSGSAPLDRIELSTARPVRLPGILSELGLFSLDGFIARLNESRHPYHPFLAGVGLQLRPHSRLVLAIQRGLMFGGSLWAGHDFSDVLGTALGTRNGSENNVTSASARLRLPTDSWLPVTLYGEWGGDDNGGAWAQVPGLVAGLSVPALPGFPEVAAGLEFSYFGRFYYRDIRWYAHGYYFGGWATGETPLGHPLGGNGREYRAYASADWPDTQLRVRGALFIRQRFAGNLYAPDWVGLSRGLEAQAAFKLHPAEFELQGAYERGAGWSASCFVATARLYF